MNRELVNLDVPLGALSVAYREYAPDAYMPLHAHDYSSISFVVRGVAEEIAGRRSRLLSGGFAALKPAGLEHADRVGIAGLTIVSLRWSAANDWPESATSRVARRDWTGGGELARRMCRLASVVRATVQAGTPCRAQIEQAAYAVGDALSGRESECGAWVEAVREFLHASCDRPISLAGAALAVNRHPVSVARAFRRQFGCSVVEYVHRLRIERAMERLAGRDASLAEVALSIGYADQAHFCRFFRRMTGRTPGQYRRVLAWCEVGS